MHTQTDTDTQTHTCRHTHRHAHRHTQTSHRHTCTHRHTQRHMHTQIHTDTYTDTCTHIQTHIHTQTHTDTDTCTHTQTYTHAHTYEFGTQLFKERDIVFLIISRHLDSCFTCSILLTSELFCFSLYCPFKGTIIFFLCFSSFCNLSFLVGPFFCVLMEYYCKVHFNTFFLSFVFSGVKLYIFVPHV